MNRITLITLTSNKLHMYKKTFMKPKIKAIIDDWIQLKIIQQCPLGQREQEKEKNNLG